MACTRAVISLVKRPNPGPPIPASAAACPAEAHHPQKPAIGSLSPGTARPPRRSLIELPIHLANSWHASSHAPSPAIVVLRHRRGVTATRHFRRPRHRRQKLQATLRYAAVG